jgi:hypothetical protein
MFRHLFQVLRARGERRIVNRPWLAYLTPVVLLVATGGINAATIALDLTCSLNGLASSGSCSPGPVFGTITLEDLTGVDAGKVEVTVDLGFAGTQNFRILMLNFVGAATTITDTDPSQNVVLINNNYSISPYGGLFDLGSGGGMGWDAMTAGPYSTVLSGNVPISTSDFLALDSLGKLFAAIHIQSIGSADGGNCDGTNDPACVPGMPGPGSLKIGAPGFRIVKENVPEPSAFALVLLSIVGAAAIARKR